MYIGWTQFLLILFIGFVLWGNFPKEAKNFLENFRKNKKGDELRYLRVF